MYKQGNKILAMIYKKNFTRVVNLLQEGSAYFITNFNVADYESAQFKMVRQKVNINFHKNTSVRPCMDFKMDKIKLFDFISFEDILANYFDQEIPFG